MNKKPKQSDRPVLVTTLNRGVFFGYATKVATDAWERDAEKTTLKLRDGRNCVYWSRECKGFMGLAANGPASGSKVGPAADITLRNITAVLEVTAAAVKLWLGAPWA